MWIVRLALRRPYTFVVVSILILIMGGLAIVRTPTDIFPTIDIPVISIIWNYNGLVPQEMSDRVVSVTERALTTTVDNIEHVESQSLYGIAVVKVFLQPTANIQQGIAQITAISQTQLRQLPAGSTPPLILAYSASSARRIRHVSFARARATWDFTVPSATPRICAASPVVRPSRSRNWNALRNVGESSSANCSTRSRSSAF